MIIRVLDSADSRSHSASAKKPGLFAWKFAIYIEFWHVRMNSDQLVCVLLSSFGKKTFDFCFGSKIFGFTCSNLKSSLMCEITTFCSPELNTTLEASYCQ